MRLSACAAGGILRTPRQPKPRVLRAKWPPDSVILGGLATTCFGARQGQNPWISGSAIGAKSTPFNKKEENPRFFLSVKKAPLRGEGASQNQPILLLARISATVRQPSSDSTFWRPFITQNMRPGLTRIPQDTTTSASRKAPFCLCCWWYPTEFSPTQTACFVC